MFELHKFILSEAFRGENAFNLIMCSVVAKQEQSYSQTPIKASHKQIPTLSGIRKPRICFSSYLKCGSSQVCYKDI